MGLVFSRNLIIKSASITLAISLLVTMSFSQQSKVLAPHRPIAPRVSKGKELPLPPGKVSSVVGGPWMVDANFKSAIYIKNVVELYAVTVTPVLYLSNGARYKLPDVNLDPAGTAIVDVNAALDSLGLASYATLSGYVELQYNFPWLPICAFIRNVDTVHSMIFLQGVQLLPAELLVGASPQPAIKQQVLEGMWWKQEANVTGFVTLSNISARPIAASVQTTDSTGNSFAAHNVTISANGTKIVPMTELASAPQTEGGIRVTYNGPQDALIANGGLEDASVGYSANMHFLTAHPNPKVSPLSAAELGLMTGVASPMMSFPAGTKFTPYSLLRNASSAPAVVTPTLWWMQAGSARSFSLSALTLQPFHTRRLDVPSMLCAAGLKNFNGSFNINFDIQAVAGAVLQAAGSVDQTNTYVFEVNARGIGVSGSRSLPYWSTGNGDDTMLTIWNPADEAQDLVLKLFFTGGQYGFPIHLGARATQTLNFSEIIQNQVPDAEGNIIPAGIHEGSAVVAGSLADNQVILFAADLGIYNVRKAICGSPTCFTCNGISAAAIAANPFAVPVAGQTQLKATVTMNTATQYDYTSSSTWSSNKTSVATVQTGLTKGVSAGSATISAFVGEGPVYAQEICSPGVCPTADPEPSSPGTVGSVTCSPSTVARGGSVTCTANGPSGSTFSSWKFSDGTNTVNGSGTSSTWSGVMVAGGTVSVNITNNGQTAPFSTSVTVNARNWHTGAASPAEVANGTFLLLPVPPASSGSDGGLGESQESTGNSPFSGVAFISDSGPNKGYGYYVNAPTFQTSYRYEINPDLENTSSTFYNAQCGNYNASTKPSGFISGSNLLTQTNRHEWNSSTESHYGFYSTSLSNSNNPGDYVESRVAAPGASGSSFDSATTSGLNSIYQNIVSAFSVEPFPVNDDATGHFLGNINYAPYSACN